METWNYKTVFTFCYILIGISQQSWLNYCDVWSCDFIQSQADTGGFAYVCERPQRSIILFEDIHGRHLHRSQLKN